MSARKITVFVLIGLKEEFLKYAGVKETDQVLVATKAPFWGARGAMTDKMWAAHKEEISAPFNEEQRVFLSAVEAAIDNKNTNVVVYLKAGALGGPNMFPKVALAPEVKDLIEGAAYFEQLELKTVG